MFIEFRSCRCARGGFDHNHDVAMSEPNDNDSSPAVSGSELNNGGLSSAATSPTPSEPMSQPFTPPTSSHVGSTHTPPTHLQNVDSGLMNESHDGSGRISACTTNIQESLKHNFELNGTDVPLDDFLLFLLATVLPRETHDIQQLGTAWKKILRAAVELCNENQDIPISPENERSFTDATSEAHMNTLQQLLLA
ncbi:hypothetical protein BC629DRAFT_915276 [Irpex lacteus]|nr:hypothetical protein BC629DRAFT_915276 [Irpex lacteus]